MLGPRRQNVLLVERMDDEQHAGFRFGAAYYAIVAIVREGGRSGNS
jgi:hypothetical protein